MSFFKKFSIQLSHFLTGGTLSLLLGFVTFPILTRILSTEQYGVLGLVTTTMSLVLVFSKAGLSNAVIRFYQEYRNDDMQKTVFASTIFYRALMISFIVMVLYFFTVPLFIKYLGINAEYEVCFKIMAAYLLIRPMNILINNMLRVNDRTFFMNALGLCTRVARILVALVLLLYVVRRFYGYFLGIAAVEFMLAIILLYWFLSNYRVRFKEASNSLTIDLIKFGAPLLITEITYLLLSYADRYMIVAWYGENSLGVYTVGYNLAMYLVNILAFSLSYTVIPAYVEVYGEKGKEQTEEFLKKVFYYIVIVIFPICLGYYAISDDLFVFLASEKYAAASIFSPIILIGTFILELNNVFNAGLYLKKKTATILKIMITAVVVNIILNIILLPRFGIIGAAFATLISCAASSALTIILSRRLIAIAFNLKHIAYYLILSVLMYAAVQQIEISTIAVSMLAKIVLGIAIIVSGVLVKEREILKLTKQKLGIG
ncbi:MAG: hypothetical protein D3926_05190 [Desulfobacteraceae bacterium]|nr:MAG: hypothetical protein D3926_05190 [Desulfobacteraceae bacterium]